MQNEIIISGFGGQGVLFAGQLLSYTAMDEGFNVTWFPSYGPEMRGGTANCTVIIADEEIGAPVVRNPKAAIVMNLPSLDKYEHLIKPDGVLIINSSMINRPVERKDLKTAIIPATEIAESLGNKKLANMILVGSLLTNLPVLSLEAVVKSLKDHTPARHKDMIPLNIQAIHKGAAYLV